MVVQLMAAVPHHLTLARPQVDLQVDAREHLPGR